MMLRRINDDDDDDDDDNDDDNDDGEGEDDGEDDDDDDDEEEEEEDDDEAATQKLGPHFVRACAVEMHVNISEESLFAVICRKNVAPQNEPRTRTHTLCARVGQLKRMSRFHKSHLIRKFTAQSEQPDQALAFTATVRTLQCGHTVWGKRMFVFFFFFFFH